MINMQYIVDKFVENIKDYMIKKDLNIKQFSDIVQIPRRTINSWILKKRSPRIDYIYQIADYLDVTIDYLVGREI